MTELIDVVHHEHDHLVRFFEDLDEQFRRISKQGLADAGGPELLVTAREDLNLGLDEMLHHFDQEEAVFFVEIATKFPTLADDVQKLVRMHEFICDQTQLLQKLLELPDSNLVGRVDEVHDYVAVIRGALRTHARQENTFFEDALEKMSPEERTVLLNKMREI